MKKNPFKKKSLMDTLTNVGIGGASNVAFDYIWDTAGLDTTLSFTGSDGKEVVSADTIKNAIKIVGGAVVGGMITNKYGRAAADGIATVGVSNLVDGLINSSKDDETPKPETGLPNGTVGRIGRRYGSAAYAQRSRRGKIAGDFIGTD